MNSGDHSTLSPSLPDAPVARDGSTITMKTGRRTDQENGNLYTPSSCGMALKKCVKQQKISSGVPNEKAVASLTRLAARRVYDDGTHRLAPQPHQGRGGPP